MDVIIHTYGRAKPELQYTLRQFLEDGIHPILLVQGRECDMYGWYDGPVRVLPDEIRQLSPTRDFIIREMGGDDHVVFMDDDLHFAVRRADDPSKFLKPGPGDLRAMLKRIDGQLVAYPMVGIGAREGGNYATARFLWNVRLMRVLAFRKSYLIEKNITFAPLVVMEDFHVNLQILESGADNCACNQWVSNQAGGSEAPGGCSAYRTAKVQEDSAELLRSLHPNFVTVLQRTTKVAWGGGVRTDVRIAWKESSKYGKRRIRT